MMAHARVYCCLALMVQAGTASAPQATQNTSQQSTANQQPSPQTNQSLVAACKQPCLEDGTPVRLRLAQTVSSADAHVNDRVEFEVLEDVKVQDVIIIPKGGIAWGTVTEAQPKRRMARGGRLEIVMDAARLVDGEKAALRATQAGNGGGHTGAMTAGIVATGLIFFPAAPFFLFMHGKDITFPKGTEVPTFVDGNFPLDLSKFQEATSMASTTAAAAPQQTSTTDLSTSTSSAEVSISSTPPGAEIAVDGSFIGNTPSTVGISTGEHVITITKKGYKAWERKVKVTSGKIALSADLERDQQSDPK